MIIASNGERVVQHGLQATLPDLIDKEYPHAQAFDERARGQLRKTDLVAREVYPSKEVRDGVLASGMEGGMRETMDQLDELVASLA